MVRSAPAAAHSLSVDLNREHGFGGALRGRCAADVEALGTRFFAITWIILVCLAAALRAEERMSPDVRFQPLRDIYDKYHPWQPPGSLADWQRESQQLREQILVACGLWPLPEKSGLNPVVHGAVDRGDYTVEKVYFASRPGLYVTGSLYRPKHVTGRKPGVLCPHGHWKDGRFYAAGAADARKQLESGAEQFLSGAEYPLQARMVELARMGCVVFHYDMIGYADCGPLTHREGFADADAPLWLHNRLGLQTWNSIRALDFLESLPDVDPLRIGVTGASGGGTQTMILCAIDPRPAVSFPAVMVSTGMQGGCACENADYLRLDINNIAIAALCAPRPQAMSGANDWTIEIETKGLPELKHVYGLYGKAELVAAHAFPQFPHNYNQVSREMMFNWFNEHLGLNVDGPVKQTDFWPLSREELTVFDEQHPRPQDALEEAPLREQLRESDRKMFADLLNQGQDPYRRVIGSAARVMLRPPVADITRTAGATAQSGGSQRTDLIVSCAGAHVPTTLLNPAGKPGTKGTVIWLDGAGKGHLTSAEGTPEPAVQKLLDAGYAVVSADLFLTGAEAGRENPYAVKLSSKNPGLQVTRPTDSYTAMTFCYNRPLLTERVRDILCLLRLPEYQDAEGLVLVGTGDAGVWALLARAMLSPKATAQTIVDLNGFSFAGIQAVQDVNMLPGALKYGGIGGLAALAYPANVSVYGVNDKNTAEAEPLKRLYAPHPDLLRLVDEGLTRDEVVRQILAR